VDARLPQPGEPSWWQFPWDRWGLLLGPAAMAAWYAWGGGGDLSPGANRLCGVLLLTIVWWITEPMPIPATGLFALALAVIVGAVPATDKAPAVVALEAFGNPTLFFLLGGMFIGRAMSRHGLDRRIALSILTVPGAARTPGSLLAAVGAAVMLISMWVSNTAATAMIYPVTLGIISVLAASMGSADAPFERSPYASALLLMTAYASSVGGIATPIGTTTNVVAMGFFRQSDYFGRPIDFTRWSLVGIPMMCALALALFAWLRFLTPRRHLDLRAVRVHLAEARSGLGAWSAGERNTLVVFLIVVTLWVAPSALAQAGLEDASRWAVAHFPEEIVALLAPTLLFLLPVDWRRRQFSLAADDLGQIDWGTLLLFGAGLCLGNLMVRTGLVRAIGQSAFDWLGSDDIWLVTAMAIAGGILLSEFTSNAAAATALIPVVMAICTEADIDKLPPLMGVTFAASFGSALPVSTPPNAIVYGSRLLPARRMMVAGIGFDIACGVVIWVVLRVAYALGWTPLLT
jgi:solute carrier family 13 (sodium-dependent dicarboxylate transporter), member 2/3/5